MLTGAGILVALLAPSLAFAAYNDVTLTTDVVVSVGGVTLNVSGSSAVIQSITVNATDISVDLTPGSSFQVTALGLEQISASTNTGVTSYICNANQSLIKFAPTASETVTITPSPTTLCSSSASSGGSSSIGGSTPTVTNTDNGGGGGGGGSAAATAPAVTETVTTPTPAVSASGLSASQIQSILDVLASFDADAATIASVKASLEGTSTGSVTSAAVHAFKTDLQLGSLGSEVKALQQFLNAHGYTVATSGAGSSGNETTRFGAATKAALIKYQKAKGITPAVGYFGAKTRAAVGAD
jgi:hypothetical protein